MLADFVMNGIDNLFNKKLKMQDKKNLINDSRLQNSKTQSIYQNQTKNKHNHQRQPNNANYKNSYKSNTFNRHTIKENLNTVIVKSRIIHNQQQQRQSCTKSRLSNLRDNQENNLSESKTTKKSKFSVVSSHLTINEKSIPKESRQLKQISPSKNRSQSRLKLLLQYNKEQKINSVVRKSQNKDRNNKPLHPQYLKSTKGTFSMTSIGLSPSASSSKIYTKISQTNTPSYRRHKRDEQKIHYQCDQQNFGEKLEQKSLIYQYRQQRKKSQSSSKIQKYNVNKYNAQNQQTRYLQSSIIKKSRIFYKSPIKTSSKKDNSNASNSICLSRNSFSINYSNKRPIR